MVHSPLNRRASEKACEALMKAAYGAAFDYIVAVVNENIGRPGMDDEGRASIGKLRFCVRCVTPFRPAFSNTSGLAHVTTGVLDIFGFETFEQNNFEQLCINYTNEALQQQFNRYVFKLEQDEYEREGILWKFISFPDNQDVLDLIDRKHTGIIALLDEQCIVPRSTDEKFTRYLYAKCDAHPRFTATSAQRVDYKFSVEHYAGPVEYGTENWLEKNKDQLPASSANLLRASEFKLLNDIQVRHCALVSLLFVWCCANMSHSFLTTSPHAPSFRQFFSRSSGPRTAKDAAPSRPSQSAPSSPSS